MKTTKLFALAALATMLLGSCVKRGDSEYQLDYLAVQVSKGDNWSIIDKDGKEVVKEEYPADARISLIRDGVFWVIQDEKYQLFSVNNPKKPVVDEEFSKATDFYGGVSAVSSPNQPIRIINTNGITIATLPKYIKRCYRFSSNGYAIFCNDANKYGLLDSNGNIVIEAEYYYFYSGENEGLLLAKKNEDDKNILILDTKGKKQGEINSDKYALPTDAFHDGKLLTRAAGDEGNAPLIALDKTGKKLFDIKKSAAGYSSGYYIDGYLVFSNAEGKWGLADDKGEVVIRPKYERMYNLGEGFFKAEKNNKSGIIDANDKTIIDFDYNMVSIYRLGHNFIVLDNDEWSLAGKDGEEITDFHTYGAYICSYAEYVDVDRLTNDVTNKLIELSEPKTAAQVCSGSEINIDDAHYSSGVTTNGDFDGKIKLNYSTYFNGSIAEEKTHTEEVNDGWFTTTRTVSDGWVWSDAVIRTINGTLSLNDIGISEKKFSDNILGKLTEQDTWKKIDDNTYFKNVTLNGRTYECRITLKPDDTTIGFRIDFNE